MRETRPLMQIDWRGFGARVRAVMSEEGLSCRAAGRRTKLTFSKIAKVCRGQPCNSEIYLTICHCFGIDPFEFARERNTQSLASAGAVHCVSTQEAT